MNPLLILEGNPSRRKGRKSRKARSPAQRAAFARMIARNPSKRSKRRKSRSSSTAVAAAPARRRRSSHRAVRRSARRHSSGGAGRSILGMVKTGAIGGGGAVLTDVAMGYLAQQFPTQTAFASRVDPVTGGINPMYYGAKALIAYGIGRFGAKVTRHAPTMAAGAYTVMAYEIIKSLVPAGTVPMGYFNPARIVQGGVGRINAYQNTRPAMNGLSKILPLPTNAASPGSVAARAMRMARGGR